MRISVSLLFSGCFIGVLSMNNVATADTAVAESSGKQLAYAPGKGNCLACHAMPTMPDAEAAGTIGPPLIAMRARYTSKASLRAEIWNAMITNPDTVMPPFGKNKILTDAEIDKITDFIDGL